jgi:hypothetical protein
LRRREGERKSGYLWQIWRVEPIKELHFDVVPDPLLVVHPQILPIAMFLIENLQMRTRINSDSKAGRVTRPFAPFANFGRRN